MDPISPEYTLQAAITELCDAHDLPGVMDHGRPRTSTTPRWKTSPR
jgi:hypothetical protein